MPDIAVAPKVTLKRIQRPALPQDDWPRTHDMATAATCKALILCGNVLQGPTGNLSLIEMFDEIRPPVFPWGIRFVVFALFTNAHEDFAVRFRVVRSADAIGDVTAPCVVETAGQIEVRDPLKSCSATVFTGAEFPEPGEYMLEAFAAGECVASRKLTLFAPPAPAPAVTMP